jgi:hypothetical protein
VDRAPGFPGDPPIFPVACCSALFGVDRCESLRHLKTDSQTKVTTARSSVRREDWHLARRCLRAVVKLVTSTQVLTQVGMRARPTTNLPPLTALLSLVLYQCKRKLVELQHQEVTGPLGLATGLQLDGDNGINKALQVMGPGLLCVIKPQFSVTAIDLKGERWDWESICY